MRAWLAGLFGRGCGKHNHRFRLCDMVPRDDRGIVRWPCANCGTEFEFEYGLQALDHGKITQDRDDQASAPSGMPRS